MEKTSNLDEKLFEEIKNDLKKKLSKKRYDHTLNVVEQTIVLCKIYNIDDLEAKFAALCHDMNKENNLNNEESIIKQNINSKTFPKDLIKIQNAWHGYTASIDIIKIYKIYNNNISDAIKYHTLGHPEMNTTAKILYIADFIEPGRTLTNIDDYRNLIGINLDEFLYKIHSNVIQYLENKHQYIAEQSYNLLTKLKKNLFIK